MVLVPCGVTAQMSDAEKSSLLACCDKLAAALQQANIRVRTDYRDNYSPGWKFNHWELKVCIVLTISGSNVAVLLTTRLNC